MPLIMPTVQKRYDFWKLVIVVDDKGKVGHGFTTAISRDPKSEAGFFIHGIYECSPSKGMSTKTISNVITTYRGCNANAHRTFSDFVFGSTSARGISSETGLVGGGKDGNHICRTV